MIKVTVERGFRPLTGILFFNAKVANKSTTSKAFPSPYGDFVFQLDDNEMASFKEALVSVPLRGFCFST